MNIILGSTNADSCLHVLVSMIICIVFYRIRTKMWQAALATFVLGLAKEAADSITHAAEILDLIYNSIGIFISCIILKK